MGVHKATQGKRPHLWSVTRRGAIMAAAGLAAMFAPASAMAQEWPQDPIELVVPFAPGGGTDLLGRALADALSEELGVPVQVINRAGGSGVVGFEEIAAAEPDGYKIGILTAQLITQNLRGVMELSHEDFTPIAMLTVDYAGVAVQAGSDWQTLDDFVEHVRANPGQVTVGNGGEGGSFHMLARNLEEQADLSFKHVPFEGGPAAILQLLGGHIDATINGPSELLPYVEAEQLRILAVAGEERYSDLPDVPTTAELGYPLDIATWRGVGMPAGVPQEIVDTLAAAVEEAAQSEKYLATLDNIGSNPDYMNAEAFKEYLRRQEEVYGRIFE